MPYPSGRAAVEERMLALLEEADEIPEEDLIRRSTITADLKKAGAVFNDLREAEQIVPGKVEGSWRLGDQLRWPWLPTGDRRV